ncbi:hypothetical protein ABFS83_03G068200 [Erythranthe nasuta]
MEVTQILHMNKGEDETSYAKNCTEAVAELIQNTLLQSMGIADLGCSSGPNTLMAVSKIIHAVCKTSSGIVGSTLPELRVSLNDLPGNDFNEVFMSLPGFYENLRKEKGIGPEGCFVSGVPGSFYGRLFARKSMHFVHSSSSLHWLSQVPPSLDMNKGKIYISKTSPPCVVKAYVSQFEKDFFLFLRSRAHEMVAGGRMLLSFMGRISPEASAEVGSHQWELLAHALTSMASEAPSPQEVRNVIMEEGYFSINHVEAFEVNWDEGSSACSDSVCDKCDFEHEKLSRGQRVAITIRVVVESMIESHFGREILDELFRRYGELSTITSPRLWLSTLIW